MTINNKFSEKYNIMHSSWTTLSVFTKIKSSENVVIVVIVTFMFSAQTIQFVSQKA